MVQFLAAFFLPFLFFIGRPLLAGLGTMELLAMQGSHETDGNAAQGAKLDETGPC